MLMLNKNGVEDEKDKLHFRHEKKYLSKQKTTICLTIQYN